MAQTGYTPILIYSSSTGSQAPSASNLTNSTLGSELAINITDGKLFYKDNANAVQVIAWKTTPTTAGGTGLTSYTAGDLLYYASGTTLTKLGIGSAYQALQVNAGGTAPSWQASATSTLTAQGDLLYASAANTLARLAKNTTATRYLANTGSSNNPAWSQVDLSNGVTGTLPIGNGGTGLTTYTANQILYASATNTIGTSANFTYNGTDLTLTGGNVVIGTSGKGIDFSATPGTGTSELFADYEEGNYDGTLTPETSGTITVNAVANRINYTKIGRVVFISGFLEIGSVASPVGTYVELNIPFTIANLAEDSGRFGTAIYADGTLRDLRGFNNGTTVFITLTAASLTTGDQFYISFNYIAA